MRKSDGQFGVKITTSHQLMDLDTDKKKVSYGCDCNYIICNSIS